MSDSMFGILKIFVNEHEPHHTSVPLHLTDFTIGSHPSSLIKLRRQGVEERHCTLKIHANGLASLHSHSKKSAASINGQDVPPEMYLLPNDTFCIVGKKFLYTNDRLPPKLIEEAKIENTKKRLKHKRQTAKFSADSSTPEFAVSTPISDGKPSQRNVPSKAAALALDFESEPDSSTVPERENAKTPITNLIQNSTAADVTTPLNNASVILISSPEEESTPLRSRKSKAKDISIQRLTQSEDSDVPATPDQKTPKSALKTHQNANQKLLCKSKLIDEFSDSASDVSENSSAIISIAEDSNSDLPLNNASDILNSSQEEEEEDISIQRLTQGEDSDIPATPEPKTPKSALKTNQSANLIEFSDSASDVGEKNSPTDISNTEDSNSDLAPNNFGDDTAETINVSLLEPSKRSSRMVRQAFVEKTANENESPTKAIEMIGDEDNSFFAETATSGSMQCDEADASDLESSPRDLVSSTPGVPSSTSIKDSSTLNEDSGSDYRSYRSTSELPVIGAKRKRQTESESNLQKRQRMPSNDDSALSAEMESFSSQNMPSENESSVLQETDDKLNVSTTAPNDASKILTRRSIRHSKENEPFESNNTTVETVDTSSFVYVGNNISFENTDFPSPVPERQQNEHDQAVAKRLLKTPKQQKEPLNDLSSPVGVKELMKTPVVHTEVVNTDVEEVTRPMRTLRVRKEPQNDLSDVAGVKQLMQTPRVPKEAQNDLTDVTGVKRLMKTPRVPKEAQNDLTDVTGVKRLMKTPRVPKEAQNDLTDVTGVKQLMKTPRVQKEVHDDLTDVVGVKELLKTPLVGNETQPDLIVELVATELVKTPLVHKESYTDLTGVKELLKTPLVRKEVKNDLSNVSGVKELMQTPTSVRKSERKRTSKMGELASTTTICNDPVEVASSAFTDLTKTPAGGNQNNESDESIFNVSGVDTLENDAELFPPKKVVRTYGRSPPNQTKTPTNKPAGRQIEEYVTKPDINEWIKSSLEAQCEASSSKKSARLSRKDLRSENALKEAQEEDASTTTVLADERVVQESASSLRKSIRKSSRSSVAKSTSTDVTGPLVKSAQKTTIESEPSATNHRDEDAEEVSFVENKQHDDTHGSDHIVSSASTRKSSRKSTAEISHVEEVTGSQSLCSSQDIESKTPTKETSTLLDNPLITETVITEDSDERNGTRMSTAETCEEEEPAHEMEIGDIESKDNLDTELEKEVGSRGRVYMSKIRSKSMGTMRSESKKERNRSSAYAQVGSRSQELTVNDEPERIVIKSAKKSLRLTLLSKHASLVKPETDNDVEILEATEVASEGTPQPEIVDITEDDQHDARNTTYVTDTIIEGSPQPIPTETSLISGTEAATIQDDALPEESAIEPKIESVEDAVPTDINKQNQEEEPEVLVVDDELGSAATEEKLAEPSPVPEESHRRSKRTPKMSLEVMDESSIIGDTPQQTTKRTRRNVVADIQESDFIVKDKITSTPEPAQNKRATRLQKKTETPQSQQRIIKGSPRSDSSEVVVRVTRLTEDDLASVKKSARLQKKLELTPSSPVRKPTLRPRVKSVESDKSEMIDASLTTRRGKTTKAVKKEIEPVEEATEDVLPKKGGRAAAKSKKVEEAILNDKQTRSTRQYALRRGNAIDIDNMQLVPEAAEEPQPRKRAKRGQNKDQAPEVPVIKPKSNARNTRKASTEVDAKVTKTRKASVKKVEESSPAVVEAKVAKRNTRKASAIQENEDVVTPKVDPKPTRTRRAPLKKQEVAEEVVTTPQKKPKEEPEETAVEESVPKRATRAKMQKDTSPAKPTTRTRGATKPAPAPEAIELSSYMEDEEEIPKRPKRQPKGAKPSPVEAAVPATRTSRSKAGKAAKGKLDTVEEVVLQTKTAEGVKLTTTSKAKVTFSPSVLTPEPTGARKGRKRLMSVEDLNNIADGAPPATRLRSRRV